MLFFPQESNLIKLLCFFYKFEYNMSNDAQMPLLASLVPKLRSSARFFKIRTTGRPTLSPKHLQCLQNNGLWGGRGGGGTGAQLEFALHELFVKYS